MQIATDPLSLVFIACFLFGLLFLLVTTFLGNLGGHVHAVGHAGHGLHLHVGSAHGHTGHATGHHGTAQQGSGTNRVAQNNASLWLAVFNPMAIVLFLLWFGFFGYFLYNTLNLFFLFAIGLACVGGIISAGLLMSLFRRVFRNAESHTILDVSNRTGLMGKVNMTILENGIGEVSYISPGGSRKSIPARSVDGQRMERGQEVIVLNYERGIAQVDTWERLMEQHNLGTSESSGTGQQMLLEDPQQD
jgi:membrane protein implicated in regulation of membrane protease activity